MSFNYTELGSRIAKRRKQLNLTQNRVEELADIAYKSLSIIERGNSRPTVATFVKLCDALECTPNQLLLGISNETLTEYTHAVNLKTKDMNSDDKHFLLSFIDFFLDTRF